MPAPGQTGRRAEKGRTRHGKDRQFIGSGQRLPEAAHRGTGGHAGQHDAQQGGRECGLDPCETGVEAAQAIGGKGHGEVFR